VGVYNYHNLLAAACIGNYFKVDEKFINEAISQYVPDNNRSQFKKTERNRLILDYYNANPTSMQVAIENFATTNFEQKFLILGDMLELGEDAEKEHIAVVKLLQEKKLNNYLLVGELFKSVATSNCVMNSEEALVYLQEKKLTNHTLLIKGSRGIKLEKVLGAL
jgi:UDP-N-acetylmuramoyl-tripeptide--D-alanyl-D-alanine ligase